MAHSKTVAILGTGIMGAAMARNLLEAGMHVRAWNRRSREKAEPLAEDGAEVADTPTGAAENADFLLTMLSDADAIEETVGEGVLPALAEGGVWLQMSTVGEEGNERLAGLGRPGTASPTSTRRFSGPGSPQGRASSSCSPLGQRTSRSGASPSSGRWAARPCGSGRRGRGAGSSWF
jgi:predicted short-subunit dehydrogenase-like oxidoreductase (DUF2520 family)